MPDIDQAFRGMPLQSCRRRVLWASAKSTGASLVVEPSRTTEEVTSSSEQKIPEEQKALDLVPGRSGEQYFDFGERICETESTAGEIVRDVESLDGSGHRNHQSLKRIERRYGKVLGYYS